MPPKAKYTREQIIDAACEIVREKGKDALTARSLAARLNVSTAPVFTAFSSVDEILNEVSDRAREIYGQYLKEGLTQPLPFKGAGLKYIQFAKDEPEYFKLLFMSLPKGFTMPHSDFMPFLDSNSGAVLTALKGFWNMPEEKAKKIYNHLSVYVYGLAVMCAQKNCMFSDEDIDLMLSEVFLALKGGKDE